MNRIDEIIVFHKLTEEELTQIVDIMLKQIKNSLQKKNSKILKTLTGIK